MKARAKARTAAVAYFRTSTLTNADGDSVYRQARAVEKAAAAAGMELSACFWDAGVSGTDPVDGRPGFKALLAWAAEAGVSTVLVEDASRFARDLMAQEVGLLLCRGQGVRILTATGQDLSDDANPERVMFRQLAGVFAHYDRAKTVQRLKSARDAKKAATGEKVEGRKSWAEVNPDLVKHAKRLARKNPKTGKARSLRGIAVELEAMGYLSSTGKRLSAQSIANMLAA